MAQITAKQVQALRAKTDLAMMDCKKALVEADGDETQALDILRKKFADKMAERSDREVANGRIGVYADDNAVSLIELRCETDFVATNDDFKALANKLAEHCAKSGITDVEAFKTSKMDGGGTVHEFLVDAFGKMKENLELRRLSRAEGPGACYVHHNGKVAAAILCDTPPGEAGRSVCMHIASTQTIMGCVREDVPPATVAEAREAAAESAQGKPEQIVAKIVDGKMNRWFSERVLVEQPFVMDDKKSIGEFGKENGFAVKSFLKAEVGGHD
jgi:elongation factor Ts